MVKRKRKRKRKKRDMLFTRLFFMIEAINKRIYIGGLHPSTTEDSIKERFGKFGEINQVTMAKDAEGEEKKKKKKKKRHLC
jgi:RNA recognition motif-containing protein